MANKKEKEHVEYYTLRPNLKQMYGKKVYKDTEFKDQTDDGVVTQEFKNLTLVTHIKRKIEQGEFVIEENSALKIKVPEGTILMWDEQEGFVIPQYQMCTLDDIKEDIKDLEEIYKIKEE